MDNVFQNRGVQVAIIAALGSINFFICRRLKKKGRVNPLNACLFPLAIHALVAVETLREEPQSCLRPFQFLIPFQLFTLIVSGPVYLGGRLGQRVAVDETPSG
jgi:hypothetical protein